MTRNCPVIRTLLIPGLPDAVTFVVLAVVVSIFGKTFPGGSWGSSGGSLLFLASSLLLLKGVLLLHLGCSHDDHVLIIRVDSIFGCIVDILTFFQ